MPTPNVYVGSDVSTVYPGLSPQFRNNLAELLYFTDRKPEVDENGSLRYGYDRSASMAFGQATVEIGKDMSWDELVAASVTDKRSRQPRLTLRAVEEISRFPETPFRVAVIDGVVQVDPVVSDANKHAEAQVQAELANRVQLSQKPAVLVYIHGYNTDFDRAALTLAELWHFLGREHVPVLYTWPAGRGGVNGYAYDRESGEFTIFHLKAFLRALGGTPQVEKVHLVAHSRGTDVMTAALRELLLELRAEGVDPGDSLRIKNLVLAAPDMDFEVILQRLVAERITAAIEYTTVYTSQRDRAIRIAERLFGSTARLGRATVNELTDEQKQIFNTISETVFVEIRDRSDPFGHRYFNTSPSASSDLILTVRYGLQPGADNGRPLEPGGINFWYVNEGYPSERE